MHGRNAICMKTSRTSPNASCSPQLEYTRTHIHTCVRAN